MDYTISRKQQRLSYIETELTALDKKKYRFRLEINASSGHEKITLEQRLEDEILPKLRQLDQEYSHLLAEFSDETQLEPIAQPMVGELIQEVEQFQQHQVSLTPELSQTLQQILTELQTLNTSATAKLKVALPIIPGLASYDLAVDTEMFFNRIRDKIQSVFRKDINTNPQ